MVWRIDDWRQQIAPTKRQSEHCHEESDLVRLVVADLLFGPVNLNDAADAVSAIPGICILDCKAL